MAALWVQNGVKPPYYLCAGLYRRELTWRDKCAHIDDPRYRRLIDKVNPFHYRFITANKIVTQGILEMFGVPVPPFYGYINARHGWTYDGERLTNPADLEGLLRRIGDAEMCFKLLTGFGGRGFLKAAVHLDSHPLSLTLLPDGPRLTMSELWQRYLQTDLHMGYFCQRVIDQHPDAACFHPLSVNTIRVTVFQPEESQWEIYGAFWRMGVDRSVTDNMRGGGIGSPIDLETGVLGKAIDRRGPERSEYREHPTSGVPIEGAVVPMWEQVVPLCMRTAALFPYVRLLAVDVALGRDGPLITEVSASPGDPQVVLDRGMGRFLRELARGSADRARQETVAFAQMRRSRG